MTNKVLLEKRISNKGMKKSYIADKLGISRTSLLNKMCGKTEFVASEIGTLCGLLDITPGEMKAIFFSNKVD